ncbi:homeobox protein CDX-4-like [Tachyglossus aculeatus]|uniref:homeobox protein CDX-4-like n=1 Tax=Tachyglossus aculeatus TaxID=9261 RepID=UPI0018F41DD7|nr:homeobox protein CDX-4-like [Tachyglossus aculeatus]
MFGSCLVDQDPPMYPGSLRGGGGGGGGPLPGQSFAPGPPYADYMGYPSGPGLDGPGQPPAGWGSPYGAPREDWGVYGAGPSLPPGAPGPPPPPAPPAPAPAPPAPPPPPGPGPYGSPDYGALSGPGPGGLPPVDAAGADPLPPAGQRHTAYEWMRRTVQSAAGTGKTRTREKYRVVYTDRQRLELEKEFHYNRYITIRRKSELAANLRLSERQVKIWFQNRRAKERKLMKKKMTHFDGSLGTIQSDSGSVSPVPGSDPVTCSDLSGALFPPPPPPPPPQPPTPTLALNGLSMQSFPPGCGCHRAWTPPLGGGRAGCPEGGPDPFRLQGVQPGPKLFEDLEILRVFIVSLPPPRPTPKPLPKIVRAFANLVQSD